MSTNAGAPSVHAAPSRTGAGFALALTLGTLATIAAPALLSLSGYLLARASHAPPILTLTMAIVGVRLFALVRAGARYAERLVSHDIALRRLTGDRVALLRRLIPVIPGSIGGRDATELLDGIVADTERVQDRIVRVLVPIGSLTITTVIAVAVTAIVLPSAAAALAIGLVVHAGALVVVQAATGRRTTRALTEARLDLTRDLVVVLDASAELVAFGADEEFADRAERRGGVLDRLVRRSAAIVSAAGGVSTAITGGTTVAVLLIATRASEAGAIADTAVPALALLAWGASDVLSTLADALAARGEVRVATERLRVLDDAPAPRDASPPADQPSDRGIDLRHIVVEQSAGRILDDVDLTIAPGERVALMGPTGVGKSTLAEVALGLLEPSDGVAAIDGVPARGLDDEHRASLITWAPQDPHLFPTSIAENVRIARPDADDHEVLAALEAVGAGPWVDRLPDGVRTRVGEMGRACSGGERQRIGLARVALSRAPYVVLDEPASHLPRDEARDALRAVFAAHPGRGGLLITHRADEADLADRLMRIR